MAFARLWFQWIPGPMWENKHWSSKSSNSKDKEDQNKLKFKTFVFSKCSYIWRSRVGGGRSLGGPRFSGTPIYFRQTARPLPVETNAGLHAGVLTGLAVEGEEVHLALVREVRDLRVVDDASDCGIVHTLRIRSNFCFQVL